MNRRSGNGTSRSQWLYILWNFPFVWVVKIGITGSLARRHKDIDKSAPGWDFPIWYIRIPFAYQVEQFVHGLMGWCRVRFWGSGRTERFWLIAAIPAIVISLAVFLVRWAVLAGAVLLAFYLFA